MAELQLRNIRKSFGAFEVIKGVSMDIRAGEFMVFVGPSGCGKSTLLRLIAGLEDISSGTLSFDGQVVNQLTPSKRGIAMVFQSYALYPHMTVFENMSFGMQLAGKDKEQCRKRVEAAAEMLQLTPYLQRLPRQLSGGQRQRVAIGRAIVRRPVAFLLDEPLSNLDAELRGSTRAELAALHARLSATMIYVTHDQVEAMTLADRIVVLRAGRIEQIGTPLELYNKPANRFVAGFIGSPHMNFLEGTLEAAGTGSAVATLKGGHRLQVPIADAAAAAGSPITLGVRPQHITLDTGESGIPAKIRLVEALGSETVLHADVAGQKILVVAPGQHDLAPGSEIRLSLAAAPIHLFNDKGLRLERAV